MSQSRCEGTRGADGALPPEHGNEFHGGELGDGPGRPGWTNGGEGKSQEAANGVLLGRTHCSTTRQSHPSGSPKSGGCRSSHWALGARISEVSVARARVLGTTTTHRRARPCGWLLRRSCCWTGRRGTARSETRDQLRSRVGQRSGAAGSLGG